MASDLEKNDIIISTKNLSRVLDGEVPVTLIHSINLDIKRGQFVTITGPSGSGKSSLLYILGLLDNPTTGSLIIDGKEMTVLSENEKSDIRNSKIGFVFQFHFLLPEFTALENVMLPMKRLGLLHEAEIKSRAKELLESLGLKNELNKIPKQLSGGQSQRVAIARALANNPAIIFADEPTGNLDSKATANVIEIFKTLAKDHQRTIVSVTHDNTFAHASNYSINLVDGTLVST